jgi:hypothetical protein
MQDEFGRNVMDEVDYEALRQRALDARGKVQPVPVVNHDDITRKQAIIVTAVLTLINITVTILGQVL